MKILNRKKKFEKRQNENTKKRRRESIRKEIISKDKQLVTVETDIGNTK